MTPAVELVAFPHAFVGNNDVCQRPPSRPRAPAPRPPRATTAGPRCVFPPKRVERAGTRSTRTVTRVPRSCCPRAVPPNRQAKVCGLGLEGQEAAVAAYAKATGFTIVKTFTEIETGKRVDRPELVKALAACRRERAVLYIAKLDRLARNVHFLDGLMEAGVEFVCCDNPIASGLTLRQEGLSLCDIAERLIPCASLTETSPLPGHCDTLRSLPARMLIESDSQRKDAHHGLASRTVD
jgi:hypothetical protein